MHLTVATMLVTIFVLLIIAYWLHKIWKWLNQSSAITVDTEIRILGNIKKKSEHYALVTVTINNVSNNDIVIKSIITSIRGMSLKDNKKRQTFDSLYPADFPIDIETNRRIMLKPDVGAHISIGCKKQFKRMIFLTANVNMINIIVTVELTKPSSNVIRLCRVYSLPS